MYMWFIAHNNMYSILLKLIHSGKVWPMCTFRKSTNRSNNDWSSPWFGIWVSKPGGKDLGRK